MAATDNTIYTASWPEVVGCVVRVRGQTLAVSALARRMLAMDAAAYLLSPPGWSLPHDETESWEAAVAHRVMVSESPLVSANLRQDLRAKDLPPCHPLPRSFAAFPFKTLPGMLAFSAAEPMALTPEVRTDMEVLTQCAEREILGLRKLRKLTVLNEELVRLREQVCTDPLTQCLRWHGAMDRFAKAAASAKAAGRHCMLAMVDLDDFKLINDSFGHTRGDLVLVEVASRLRQWQNTKLSLDLDNVDLDNVDSDNVDSDNGANLDCETAGKGSQAPIAGRPHTQPMSENFDEVLVARYGGDEFIVFFDHNPNPKADASRRFRRALESLFSSPIPVDDQLISVGASVGVASSRELGWDVGELLERADTQMYEAKNRKSFVGRS